MAGILDFGKARAERLAGLGPHPSGDREEVRQNTIATLQEALKRAIAGEADECVVILYRHTRDGTDDWDNLTSYTTSITRWIGRLEVTKSDWIDVLNEYREGE